MDQIDNLVGPAPYRTSSMRASLPAISCLSGPVTQNGPGQRRHVGDRAAGGIGLIFTYDPKALLPVVVLRRITLMPKDNLLLLAGDLTTSALRAAPSSTGRRAKELPRLPCRFCLVAHGGPPRNGPAWPQ